MICCQCGGPRSALSGKRCRRCYLANARQRRANNAAAEVAAALLEGERLGHFVMREGIWHASEWHWKHCPHLFVI